MSHDIHVQKQRQRAPSKRSLQTKERILDAAERVFASHGFDGATIRDIASEANTQVGLVHHHGGGKTELFKTTVARRADELSCLRLIALSEHQEDGPLKLDTLLEAFFGPYINKAKTGGPQWLAYARLVAIVSADPRWRDVAEQCFDPTARQFIDEIIRLYPDTSRQIIASGFVFSVSSMLALLTSRWRIQALGTQDTPGDTSLDTLVRFCAAGIHATACQNTPS